MLRLAAGGMIGADLAIRFGVARSCISRVLAREGFQYKRTYRPPPFLSQDDLASAIDVSPRTASRTVRSQNGLKCRGLQ